MPGYFLVFEGLDGSGKSTQAMMLESWFRDHVGRDVLRTFEPGATELGKELRAAVLHGEDVDPLTETLLYATDRAHHVHSVIRPALDRGVVVLCDRYIDSSIAYQGVGRDLDMERVVDLQRWATGGLVPTLTVLLDLDNLVGRARLGGTEDRLEREPDAFHARVREMYLEIAAADPTRYLVVDAELPRQRIHEIVRDRVAADVLAAG